MTKPKTSNKNAKTKSLNKRSALRKRYLFYVMIEINTNALRQKNINQTINKFKQHKYPYYY